MNALTLTSLFGPLDIALKVTGAVIALAALSQLIPQYRRSGPAARLLQVARVLVEYGVFLVAANFVSRFAAGRVSLASGTIRLVLFALIGVIALAEALGSVSAGSTRVRGY